MNNHIQKVIKWATDHKVVGVIVLVAVGLFCWWLIATYMPHPLGSKMEYLGKEDYGNIFGFDSFPASVYYYGTDMSIEEVEKYFGKAKRIPLNASRSGAIILEFDSRDNGFSINHYWEKSVTPFKTNKKYIVSVASFHYKAARNAIR